MKIEKKSNGESLELAISGRLDTLTAPELEKELDLIEESNVTSLVIDMKNLEYTSSAGLRALLKAQKIMNIKGTMKLVNVNEIIMEVFEITGFNEMLTIE